MPRVAHVIGNGDKASLYKPAPGIKITCNLPPFAVEGVYATCIVDFKMMRAIHEGSVVVPGNWILGFRPKKYLEKFPTLRLKYSGQIREIYTELPEYVKGYTDFNCGHMAVHYSAFKLKADEVHLYGFDSMFSSNLRSCTDFYLSADRSEGNNYRLLNNWRPIWSKMFEEFSHVNFKIHHVNDNIKFDIPKNVEIIVH